MGFKVQQDCNAVHAKFEDSKLIYELGNREFEIDVPVISTLTFGRQCNQFICDNVIAYLIGDKYSLILRRDGTGCVFTTKERILCKNFMYTTPSITNYFVSKGGSYRDVRTNAHSMVELYYNSVDCYVLSIIGVPVSVTFQARDNPEYLIDTKSHRSDGFPELKMIDGELFAINQDGKINYKVNGTVTKSNGFIIL